MTSGSARLREPQRFEKLPRPRRPSHTEPYRGVSGARLKMELEKRTANPLGHDKVDHVTKGRPGGWEFQEEAIRLPPRRDDQTTHRREQPVTASSELDI